MTGLGDKRNANGELANRLLTSVAIKKTKKEINLIKNLDWFNKISHYKYYLLIFSKKIYKFYLKKITEEYIQNPQSDFKNINFDYKINLKIESTNYFKKYIKKYIKKLIPENKNYFQKFHNLNSFNNNTKSKIAISYVSGILEETDNDIYWVKDSKISRSDILIYMEKKNINNFGRDGLTQANGIRKKGFSYFFVDNKIKNLQKKLNINKLYNPLSITFDLISKIKNKSEINKWIFNEITKCSNEIIYWYNFFKHLNIKIHTDPTEAGDENICKNIALTYLDALSFGKERSFITDNINSGFIGYYPNDIFFVWGKTSAKNFLKTINIKENVIITGNPTILKKQEDTKNDIFIDLKRKPKFTILLIDNYHSYNKTIPGQAVYTPFMKSFYEFFLNWVLEDDDFGLIIKTKKPYLQNSLNINDLLRRTEKTGRCYNSKNPLIDRGYHYANLVTLSVSINIFFSSALIENVILGNRGVHFDYMNSKIRNESIYSWGENKVIFNDFDKFKSLIKKYKNNTSNSKEIGDWSKFIDEIEPFRDNLSPLRIANYIDDLKEGYDKNLNKYKNIEIANKNYVSKWGNDKIFENKNII